MAEDGYISLAAAAAEMAGMVRVRPPSTADAARADYFVEEVRENCRNLVNVDSMEAVFRSGRPWIRVQRIADTSLRWGLSALTAGMGGAGRWAGRCD